MGSRPQLKIYHLRAEDPVRAPTNLDVDRAVLALDRIIQTGRYEEFAELNRALAPTALLDQFDAATAHVEGGLRSGAARFGYDFRDTRFKNQPGWVLLGLLRTLLSWKAGRGSTCMHGPNSHRPAPVFAAAWRPDLVVCGQCSHLILFAPGSSRDRTCDGCGYITPGLEHDEGIYPGGLVAGPLTYFLGVCSGCRWWT